jgi:hypothetical protein
MMNKQFLSSHWTLGLSFLMAFSAVNAVWAQGALERLEKQIRQRVGQDQQTPPPPRPGLAQPAAPAPETTPASSVEKRTPGYLGLMADDRQDRGRGVRVIEVYADGPAAKGGLKKQDLITSVSGVRTRQMSEMADVMNLYAVGEIVEFEVLRDNIPLKLKVTLGRRPPEKAVAGQSAESIPLPPGEAIANEPPKEPAKDVARPEGVKMPSILELFKPKSTNTGDKKPAEPNEALPPALIPPRPATPDDRPSLEQLQSRIEQLERRLSELEKTLEETRKEK